MLPKEIAIGQVAQRTGMSISQIRFYEKKGLIAPPRDRGGHRRFPRADLRRLSFIRIAQRLGLSLGRIRAALGPPGERPMTQADWDRVATGMRAELTDRIEVLTKLRDNLAGCIGCGCLSMVNCPLYNDGDALGADGPGARLVERAP
ncbi:redox-sensitive transcriptional activator SoxR [Jannaschia sp. LMIT008]|uniref:redox-sensitive transcriptional activator SoxR n=1 Tax=Jannaschia maritima TaxID=3032585 RepID=UPI002810CFB0|nr:redox-sensitive transcriptional activator SoxR [Jannaschia sp. LMIT008]